MAACTNNSCAPQNLSRSEKRKVFAPDPANPQGNWEDLRNFIVSLGQPYVEHAIDVAQIENNLHDMWDILIQTAKITPAISPEHDRLVNLVLLAREFGIFHRKKKDGTSNEEKEEAILTNGQRFWTDLPYLVEEIQDAWTKESKGFTVTERHNFAVFTAKLCAVGVCDTELSFCALWLIREALETERSLTKSEGDGEDKNPLSIADILPACLAWFQHNNFKLLKLAVQNYDHTPATTGDDVQLSMAPGDLAVKANVTQSGFSVARWLFWRQRFKELSRCGNEQVAKLGKEGFDEMVRTGIALGYDIPGEKKYWEKVFETLDQEFVARGGKDCVGPDDVEIDMDWAD
ncbi:hypothetical protein VTN77DRAFT_1298 [Rasamsonia byssochlamydoides]|uniref:uncharacterized protein n=1 Tax=Rasamsonia byssochlamydoides TaxID=89139 RepID=UPI003742F9FB